PYQASRGDETANIKLEFRQEMEVLVALQDGRSLVSTTGQGVDRQCAWIDERDVLVGKLPRKVSDLNKADTRITKNGREVANPLFIKALIRSNPEIGAIDESQLESLKWEALSVPIYRRPEASRQYLERNITIFGLFRAYKERKTPGGTWHY